MVIKNHHSNMGSEVGIQSTDYGEEFVGKDLGFDIFRSPSAPPTVEGGKREISDEELRSDPAYVNYYYSNVNLNPRLPPPLLSKEDWRFSQRVSGGGGGLGGIGDRRRVKGGDEFGNNGSYSSNSLFSKQPGFNGQIEESVGQNEWSGVGLPGLGLGTRQKSIAEIIQAIDSTFIPKPESRLYASSDPPRARPLTKEDFQIKLGVERFRCPEILFNPSIIGIDQSGLDEMVGISLRRFSQKGQEVEEKITNFILLTGGSCLFPGMSERLEVGVRMIRPCGAPIRVMRAKDLICDAWRGASSYAASRHFSEQTFSRMDYYDKGEEWLRTYKFRYTF